MGTLSDRVLMLIIVITGVGGLVGYMSTFVVTEVPGWFTQYALPGIFGVLLLALAVGVWTTLDTMD